MAGLLAAWLRLSQLSQSEKLGARAENEAMTDVRADLPPPGCRLLYHMDVEGGVDHLGQLEEVGIGGVGRRAAKDSLIENIL